MRGFLGEEHVLKKNAPEAIIERKRALQTRDGHKLGFWLRYLSMLLEQSKEHGVYINITQLQNHHLDCCRR
jgi:hypothetical protein